MKFLLGLLCLCASCDYADKALSSRHVSITCEASSHEPAYHEAHTITLSRGEIKKYLLDMLDELSQLNRSLYIAPDEPSYTFIFKNEDKEEIKSFVIAKRLLDSEEWNDNNENIKQTEIVRTRAIALLLQQLFHQKLDENWETLFSFH